MNTYSTMARALLPLHAARAASSETVSLTTRETMTETNDITINIRAEDDPAAWMQEDRTSISDHTANIQLELDPKRRRVSLPILNSVERDGTPHGIYHGRRFRLRLPDTVDATRLRDWLDDHSDLISRIFDGHDTEWDGAYHVACMTDDARVALDRLRALLVEGEAHPSFRLRSNQGGHLPEQDYDEVERQTVGVPTHDITMWDASDWLAPTRDDVADEFGITSETSEDQLETIAAQLEDEARSDGIKLTGTLTALLDIRED